MKRYFSFWITASLIMPVLVAIVGRHLNDIFILVFWPGAIALMSLGAEQRPFTDVTYVWSVAIALNIALYLIIGLVFLGIIKIIDKYGIANSNAKS